MIKASVPFRMFEVTFRRSNQYSNYVLGREYRVEEGLIVREGFDDDYTGDWEHDITDLYERRNYKGVTMFCVFDYETKELVRSAKDDSVMFYSSLEVAYEDQNVGSEEDFNLSYLIFEVPDLKAGEVKADIKRQPATFNQALKQTDKQEGWSTSK